MAVAIVDIQVNSQAAVRNLQQLNGASKNSASALEGLGGIVGKLGIAFSAIGAAKFIFAKTAEIETQTRSIQVLTGSVEQAKQIVQELQQLGAVTPFTSTELIDSAKRLQAFGVQAKDVVDTTRKLADVAGATGAELDGLVTAYGQVQAKGRLQGEELLQFQERGIALQGELRKMYGMTGEEFQKALSKGQISAQAVEVAITRLTEKGGKYANGAIAQSDTLAGKFSTLTDGIDQLARTIGTVLAPVLKDVLGIAIQALDNINAALSAGRAGNFRRNQAAARTALSGPFPATSQAIDIIASGIAQISSQSNKTGIQQNLAALQEYQAILRGIRADQVPDPRTQNKMLALQGTIFQKIRENAAALERLPKGPQRPTATTPPPLLTPTAPAGGTTGGKGKADDKAQQQRAIAAAQLQTSEAQRLYDQEGRILEARAAGNKQLEIARQAQAELLRINYEAQRLKQDREMPAAQRKAELDQLAIKAATVARQLEYDINAERQAGIDAAAGAMQQLQDELNLQQAKLNGTEAQVILEQQLHDLKVQFPALDQAEARAIIDKTNALKGQVDAAQELKQVYADIGMSIKSGVVGAIQGAIDGTKSLQQVAVDLLNNIANKLLDVAVNMALFGAMSGTGTGGGLLGFMFKPSPVPGRAVGGSVASGQPYIVGERGPELFMPGRSGTIIPNHNLGGGGISVVVNVDASGSSVSGDQTQGKQLGMAVSAAVQAELLKQKRPGGLLA